MKSRLVCFAGASLLLGLAGAGLRAQSAVTLTEDATYYTLANGIVTARIAKDSGDLISLRYQDTEMLATIMDKDGQPDLKADPPGANSRGFGPFTDHQYGFWSHDAMGPRGTTPAVDRVTIDPAANGGERAEVSILGVSGGRKMGTGPGSNAQGNFIADVEIRYALGRGDSGLYTYSIFTHRPEYPASSLTEARFCAKLNDSFDWMSVSPKINMLFPRELHEGDKYIYTADQYDNRAFGWSSTTRHVGFWIVNPTVAYLSGGPTKVEFLCHRDTNKVAAPCVLNYWRSSHYGGALVDVAAGEAWTKVIGPFLLYVNSGGDPQALYADARAQADKEAAKWPYAWVEGVAYPHARDYGSVAGWLILRDPYRADAKMSDIMVGLTAPDYESPVPGRGGVRPEVTWQTDAKHYEYWVHAFPNGRFQIPAPAGTYTLRAFATGVLGEFAQADVTVTAGQLLSLKLLPWKTVAHGRMVWEIGIPNRNATEFFMGEDYADPEISLKYAQLFPNDVHYVVGKSDYRKDWFFQQVPHNEDPNAKAEPFFGVRARGRATPYEISFEMPEAPRGAATLRLAICGTGARQLEVTVDGRAAGTVALRPGDGVITRHGVQGIWYERDLAFDAAWLHAGTNTLTLTVPAGPVNDGVVYDYLRLELDPYARPPAAP